jgi:hypothetical protein
MRILSVIKGNTTYVVLGYLHNHINQGDYCPSPTDTRYRLAPDFRVNCECRNEAIKPQLRMRLQRS